jgi:F-type H+-transporting ATPase subunit delta
MARGAVARRYAKALFELAVEEDRVAELRSELASFAELLDANAELRDVLLRPLHPVAQRRAVLEAVAGRLGGSGLLQRFYAVLIDQRRLLDFTSIREEFERLADARAGITQAKLRTASPLEPEQLERLKAALAARTGGRVELDVQVDDHLLGGVVAQVGDLVFDGSLRSQLEQLRANLVRA